MSLRDLYEAQGLPGPTVIKIDVEGHEDKVLLPFFDSMPAARWPRYVVIEAIEREGLPDCIAHMRSLGYRDDFKTRSNLGLALGKA